MVDKWWRRLVVPPALRRDPLLILAVLWTLAGVALLFALNGRPDAEVRTFWLFQPPLDALLAYSSWRVSQIATGPIHRFWRALAIIGTLFTIGDSTQVLVAFGGHGQHTTAGGTIQSILFGVGDAALIVVMLIHPHPRRSRRDTLAFWLDSVTVLIGGAVVAWCFTVDPEGGADLVSALITAAAILTSGFAAVKLVLSGNAPMHKMAALPMVAASVVNGAGVFIAQAGAELPAYVYVVRLLPSLLIAAGPRVQQILVGFDETAFGSKRRKPYSLLPYGSIAVTFTAVLMVMPEGLNLRLWGAMTGLAAIITLVVGRQLSSFHYNTLLINRLDDALGELREHETRLRQQALFDGLTGLANRTHFHEEVTASLGAGELPALLLIDLDGFKSVNDTLGHAAGDALLAGVAERLNRSVRPTDLVARLGGDEFAVLLRGCSGPDGEVTSQRILRELCDPVPFGDTLVRANASIGVACAEPGDDVESLLRDADLAMYAAKHGGKGTWMRYQEGMAVAHG